jgi:saccharopine dehydrogenase-like NADP-dependent oxidoreductase
MAPQFAYILKLRAAQEAAAAKRVVRLRRRESFVTLHLRGHLFDSGAINRVLDAVEAVEGASCVLQAVTVGASGDDKSEASMSLFASEAGELSTAVKAVVEAATALDTQVDVAGSDDTPVSPTAAAGAGSLAGLAAQSAADATAAASPSLGMPRSGSGASIADTVALAARSSATSLSQLPRFDMAAAAAADPLADLASGLRSAPPKRVLLLGAGMVTRPLVRYLLRRQNNTLTVCSALPGEAEALCSGRARASPKHMAVSLTPEADQPELGALVAGHDLVISMLPAFLHVGVARLCVARGRHMVTASYISAPMEALHEQAVAANVLLLNEMGVDPGFDHMSAMRMISEAKAAGEVITGFESCTGGLPAPEVATNPLGYRFSWSPRGALVAARNAARFIRDGGLVKVAATDLLASAEPYSAGRGFALEVLPNRDSTSYAPKYGLGAAKTDGGALESLFRGTLRYRGFSRQLLALASLGLLDAEPCGEGHDAVLDQAAAAAASAGSGSRPTMRDWLASRCGVDASAVTDAELVAAVCARADSVLTAGGRTELDAEERAVIGEMLGFSGLLGSGPVPSLDVGKRSAVDALAVVLGALPDMQYSEGQRDMVVMQHRVRSRNTAGQTVERSALLVEYERGGESAMARTVGLTAAISAQLVLDGAIKMRGVRAPVHAEIYEPVLDALEGEGISMQEKQRILA